MSVETGLAGAATAVFAVLGCWLALTDVRTRRLPNRQVALTGAAVLALLTAASVVAGTWAAWGRGLLAGAVLAAAYLIVALVSAGGVGMGDVKLAAVVGLICGWHGWAAVVTATVATFLLAAAVGLALLASRRASRNTTLAFGPFMVAGTLLALATA